MKNKNNMNKGKIIILAMCLVVFGFACGGAETAEAPDSTPAASPATEASPAESGDAKKEEAPKSDLDPSKIDLEKPIPAGDLKAAMEADEKAWIGKEVSVVGRYGKTTKSTIEGAERIRVDLQDKDKKTSVGCVVSKDVSEDVVNNREDRVFKGKILEMRYSRPLIEPCEFVK